MNNKPINDNTIPEETLVLHATVNKEGGIKYSIGNISMSTLCYVYKLIGVEIDKRIIDQKIQASMASKNGIIIPKKHGIMDFIRRKNN